MQTILNPRTARTRSRARNLFAGIIAVQMSALQVAFGALPCFAALESSDKISEKIHAASERVAAIEKIAVDEKRDLSDDEQAEVDRILGKGIAGTDTYSKGEIERLNEQLERAKKIEANQASLAMARAQNPTRPDATLDLPKESAILIPARMINTRPLSAFSGNTLQDKRVQALRAAHFYAAALFDHQPSKDWCKSHGVELVKAAQTGGTDAKGGFLVPNDLEAEIIRLRYEYGIAASECDVRMMSSDTKDIVKEVGDPEAAWLAVSGTASERAAVTETDFDYANIRLVANKMGLLVRYSSEIDEDAFLDMANELTERLARAFAKTEDKTLFLGDASAGYGGFTGICPAALAGAVYTFPAGILTYAAMTLAHFNAIVSKVADYADENCKWYVNKRLFAGAMAPILDAAGGNLGVDIANGSGRKLRRFLDYEVRTSAVFPKGTSSLASAYVGVFGDIRQGAIMGQRRGLRLAISDQRYFDTDEIAIRGTARAAIYVHEVGTSTDCGSLVVMKMPAS